MIAIPADISEFGREFFEFMRAHRPDILEQGRFYRYEEEWCFHLGEDIHGTDGCIHISTEFEEVTISFGRWHDHFPLADDGRSNLAYYQEAMDQLLEIVEERAVIIRKNDGPFAMLGSPAEAEEAWRQPYQTVEVKSFRRTYDQRR